MLFTYTQDALEHNWLNQTFVDVLSIGLQQIKAGNPAPLWPECLPADRRAMLTSRTGIRDRLAMIWIDFKKLDVDNQTVVLEALVQQTNLPEILTSEGPCTKLDGVGGVVKESITNLFRFLFELLSEIKEGALSLRDIHYQSIYKALKKSKICPFCGLGYFRAPRAPRHDLDHYMLISKYPFAGADFRNLPPMCSECNSDFKATSDILYSANGDRRLCSDPYVGPTYTISLANSRPFEGNTVDGIVYPRWHIEFCGESQAEAKTWNEVFEVRERYQRDILDADFLSWLSHFAGWYSQTKAPAWEADAVASSLPEYIATVIQEGWADRAFLKAEVFRMLSSECQDADRGAATRAWLKDVVEMSVKEDV